MKTNYQQAIQEMWGTYGVTPLNSKPVQATPTFGETQRFQTPVFEIYLHRLPAGAQISKEMHYLPRIFFALRSAVQMYDRTSYHSKTIAGLQSILIHAYTECQIVNESQEEAWVLEFCFFTMEALPSPSVRTVMPWQHPFYEGAQQFQVPDWHIQILVVHPQEAFKLETITNGGHVLIVDQFSGNADFSASADLAFVDGARAGKVVMIINGNPELW